MPIPDSPYTNSDMIEALYNDPANVALNAEYALQTGGIQLGAVTANFGGINAASGLVDAVATGVGGPCFVGATEFLLFNAKRVPMAELYENRADFIGKGAASFTNRNQIVPGEILDVFKHRVFETLQVAFKNEKTPMEMVHTHRFWLKSYKFMPMCLTRQTTQMWAYDEKWFLTNTLERKVIKYPDGIEVYNASIGTYHDYFAAAPGCPMKAVSNNKRNPSEDDPLA